MIRLSRLADYAVAMMTHIAAHPAGVHNAIDVSAATHLPTPTVSKILATLARRHLLASHRGAKGGYTLARSPAAISVAEIVSAIDGPIALTHCIVHGPGACEVEPVCPSRSGWNRLNNAVRTAFESVSLADLIEPGFAPPPPARTVAAAVAVEH